MEYHLNVLFSSPDHPRHVENPSMKKNRCFQHFVKTLHKAAACWLDAAPMYENAHVVQIRSPSHGVRRFKIPFLVS